MSIAPPPESRVEGLYDVRRWLIRLLFSEAWLFAALAGLLGWRQLGGTDRAMLVISAACIVVGWILSRRAIGLWIIAAAPLCLVIAAAMSGADLGGARWIAVSVSVGHVAYGLVLLTGPRVGIASIAVACIALALIWSQRPGNVVPGALDVAGGWISVASLGLSAGVLWYVWHALMRQARADDARLVKVAERVQEDLAVQERSRLWRSTVVAVHERLLSTLRYILQSERIDRDGLRRLAELHGTSTGLPGASTLAEDVREATAARIATGIVRVDSSAIDLPLSNEARRAVRAAIVECALNAVLHGAATDVQVAGRLDDESCWFAVSDNGSGIPVDAKAGLGWTTTLDEGLAAIGGTWSVERLLGRTVVTFRIPRGGTTMTSGLAADGFQQGRILIASPLVAVGLVGAAYTFIAGANSAIGWPLMVATALAIAGAVTIVARRRQPSLLASSAVILGLAAVPWLTAWAQPSAGVSAAVIAGVTTAGYALIAVGVWSRWWQWTVGLVIWAVGVLFDARLGSATGQPALPTIVALVNCLVIVPVVVIVASIGTRRFQRAQAALAVEREALSRESLRATSARTIDQHLSACVAQADGIIAELANGADLDPQLRHQVACLEGLIRATIQVDPVDSGEFARVAGRLVNSAFSQSIPAQVGTLVCSNDRTPLDPELVLALESLIGSYGRVTVRSVSDGLADHLGLELRDSRPDAPATAMHLRSLRTAEVDIEATDDPDGSLMVLVTRRIPVHG